MKTTIIPAQITTVEDKIAGNLSLTQILILMFPVFWAGIVYILFVPTMSIAWYKLVLTIPVLIISFILSLKIDEKLIINWLILILRYNIRPKYYVFNKNDAYLREAGIVDPGKKHAKSVRPSESKRKSRLQPIGVREQSIFEKDKENITFKIKKKGGFNVVLDQIEK